jgi:hypothetical protein
MNGASDHLIALGDEAGRQVARDAGSVCQTSGWVMGCRRDDVGGAAGVPQKAGDLAALPKSAALPWRLSDDGPGATRAIPMGPSSETRHITGLTPGAKGVFFRSRRWPAVGATQEKSGGQPAKAVRLERLLLPAC